MNRRKKWVAGCGIALVIGLFLALTWLVGKPLVAFASEPAKFRLWVDSHGVLGRLTYMGMVILQVIVALIPGEPFEIAAGYAFGALEGTFLCLLSAFLGSILVFLLVRKFGMRFVELFFSKEKIQSLKFLHTDEKRDVIFFIIFMIPGTPKDLLCYFAGLTDMPLGMWLLISSVGRLPAIITSTVGGDALGTQNYGFAVGVFVGTLALSLLGLWIYRRICRLRNDNKGHL